MIKIQSSIAAALLIVGIFGVKHPSVIPAIDAYCQGLTHVVYAIVELFTDQFYMNGIVIRHSTSHLGVTVDKACSAIDIVIAAACVALVFTASKVPHRLINVVWVVLLMQVINVFRILILLLSQVYITKQFNFVHDAVFPFIMPAAALSLLWLTTQRNKKRV